MALYHIKYIIIIIIFEEKRGSHFEPRETPGNGHVGSSRTYETSISGGLGFAACGSVDYIDPRLW